VNQIRKISKHLIGFSLLAWVLGFFFLNTDILIGYIFFPISAIMVTLGIIGWASKPKTKFDRAGYATHMDVLLGWLWNRFAPRWFTFCLFIGIMQTNFFTYSVFEKKVRPTKDITVSKHINTNSSPTNK